MREAEIEKLAFLYVCGKRDRAILLGRRNMVFVDFCRLEYLTASLGFDHLNRELWKNFSEKFKEQLEKNEQDKEWGIVLVEDEIEKRESWIREFLEGIPDEQSKELCEQMLDR